VQQYFFAEYLLLILKMNVMKKLLFIAAIAFVSCNNSSEGSVAKDSTNTMTTNSTNVGNGSDSANIPGSSTTTGAGIGAGTDSNLNRTPDTSRR
jgi:hypothetical protein